MLNVAAREAIGVGNLEHLATTNPVGSPQKSAVLVGLEDDQIVAAHLAEYQKVRLEGCTGIHVGEVEHRGDDIGGVAVHLAARAMGEAAPGGIHVTSAVDETTLGPATSSATPAPA